MLTLKAEPAIETLEVKAAITVDDAGTIAGTAWPFGSADRVGDLIEKGAFTAPARQDPGTSGQDRSPA